MIDDGHEIAMILEGPFLPDGEGASYRCLSVARLLAQLGFRVTVIKIWRGWSEPARLAREPFSTVLFSPDDVYGAAACFTEFLARRRFAIVQTKLPAVVATLLRNDCLPAATRLLFECHDLPGTGSEEEIASGAADAVVALSPYDAQRLRELTDKPVHHLTCFVPDGEVHPRTHNGPGTRIAMLGNLYYEPNAESVRELVRTVLPLVHERVPAAELHVIGPVPADLVTELGQRAVTWYGRCEDPVGLLRDCDVAVSYLRAGTGFRVKLLHYMAAGLPVVANRLGAGGWLGGEHVFSLADDPARVASLIAGLLTDQDLRRSRAYLGLTHLLAGYTAAGVAEQFAAVYGTPPARTRSVVAGLEKIPAGPPHWITELIDKGRPRMSDPYLVTPGSPLPLRTASLAASR